MEQWNRMLYESCYAKPGELVEYTNTDGPDQSAHLGNLIKSFVHFRILVHCNYPKYMGRQVWANGVVPHQTPQNLIDNLIDNHDY